MTVEVEKEIETTMKDEAELREELSAIEEAFLKRVADIPASGGGDEMKRFNAEAAQASLAVCRLGWTPSFDPCRDFCRFVDTMR